MITPEEIVGEEWAAWYRLSLQERWHESEKLWQVYFYLGGSLDTQPDTQSLSSIRQHRVQALLMGGQACVFYGAAEFSRDTIKRHKSFRRYDSVQRGIATPVLARLSFMPAAPTRLKSC